jgi:membrane-bound metal-dependent hydrolase YbcI (DUF457 family)
VLVLTETKDSAGCHLLADAFTTAGYHITYPNRTTATTAS